MTPVQTIMRIWEEANSVFNNTSYAFFNIEAYIVCITVLIILFNKQQASLGQNDTQITYSRSLFIQILYCVTGILRVLLDIGIIPKTDRSLYLINALNFGLFSCLCWLSFLYIEYSQKSETFSDFKGKIISSFPFLFNIIILALNPLTGLCMEIRNGVISRGPLANLFIIISLAYPAAAIILSVLRRNKMRRYDRESLSFIFIYPAFFLIFGPLQLLNWKIPFLYYAVMVADIFIYINYADSLVSVDPLTKISNKNGLVKTLSERLKHSDDENPEEREKLSKLHLFAVDIEDLAGINSTYGRNEGDRALLVVASALRKFREQEHPCYISRYYGDEFMIIANINDDDELELFIEHIKNYISNAVTSSNLNYHIRVSIGYSKYEIYSRTETLAGLIEETERVLNENKEQRKFQTIWHGGKRPVLES